ncbi:glycoside hydrolase family 16 protein [Hydnum rufescens UP504]|uniref:Glycoside hydrolase family 16 protein n=1 Tax=Hydnum rufescens UP504 TaxID=1448309 RepID=A0A9P6DXR4_9AGAM|nr:glycoside hydrolase family 16 protein [Hydnum rufescens UP504]
MYWSLFACLLGTVYATEYLLSDRFVGNTFFTGFTHEAIPDPTHGRVHYVDRATAIKHNLSWASNSKFTIRADHTTVLSPSGSGRMSVRLKSNRQWATSVLVLDITHMPRGCGTWPAFWTLGDNWPYGGEIDVIEGVNSIGPNQASLHTSAGCTQPPSTWPRYSGTLTSTNCDTYTSSNVGCGIKSTSQNSFGPAFNSIGGGWYAMERTNRTISIWFWPRHSPNVPRDVKSGTSTTVRTQGWGTPMAAFVDDTCPISSLFSAHNIIINLTFCGDWAGSVYSSSGCPGSCVDYVDNNPEAFVDAYFEFNSLRIYTPKTSGKAAKIVNCIGGHLIGIRQTIVGWFVRARQNTRRRPRMQSVGVGAGSDVREL